MHHRVISSFLIDEQQGLNKHHESRVIIAAIKTLIIRAIIAQ